MNLNKMQLIIIVIIAIFLSSYLTIYIGNNTNLFAPPEEITPPIENVEKPDEFGKLEESSNYS